MLKPKRKSTFRKDLTGKRFGKLVVTNYSEQRLRDIPSWDCVCDCGNTKTACGMDIVSGQVKSCGCDFHRGTPKDIAGERFGSLVAISRLGLSNNGDYRWLCKCDCGNEVTPPIGQLKSGSIDHCGCLTFERASKAQTQHGMSKSKEHKSWSHAKERIYDKNCVNYPDYGGRGLLFEQDWLDFSVFIKEVGIMPQDGKKYSLDKIDNNLGYVRGNVRWATMATQARNKTFQANNSSGKSGVIWDNKTWNEGANQSLYANAVWNILNGKQTKKCFSVKVYGLLPAFAMACAYREKMIKELNEQGAGYSENHGK